MANTDASLDKIDSFQIRLSLLSEMLVQIAELTGRLTLTTIFSEGRCSKQTATKVVEQLVKEGRLIPKGKNQWTTLGWIQKGVLVQDDIDELIRRKGREITPEDLSEQYGISSARAVLFADKMRLALNARPVNKKDLQRAWIRRRKIFEVQSFSTEFMAEKNQAHRRLCEYVTEGLVKKVDVNVFAHVDVPKAECDEWVLQHLRTWRPKEGGLCRVVSDLIEKNGAITRSELFAQCGKMVVNRALAILQRKGLIRIGKRGTVVWKKVIDWKPEPGSPEAVLAAEVEQHGAAATAEKYKVHESKLKRIERFIEVKDEWAKDNKRKKRVVRPRRDWWTSRVHKSSGAGRTVAPARGERDE
jgi:hypothetical protein